jgi:DNA-binding MarR family transcriptional regulator
MAITMRPSQALRLWQQVLLAEVHDDAPTIRALAARLGVTKPVITRALDTMGSLKLVSRHRDELDRRNVLVRRTVEGALYVERLGDAIIAKALDLPI